VGKAPFWRRHAGDALFLGIFFVLAALNVQPFWVVHWLPGTDTGGHLELMDIAARLHDAGTAYADTYALGGWLQPNIMGIWLSRLFHPWLSTLTVGRLMLSFYAIGLPAGAWALTHAFGRSRWLSLLTFPLVFNYSLTMGFFNYVVAIPLLLFCVAVARRYADLGGVRRGLTLMALLALTFFTHAIAFLVAGGIATYLIALGHGGLKRRALGALYIFGGSAFCLVWGLRKFFGWGSASGPPMTHHASGPAMWVKADVMLSQLPRVLLDFSKGHTDDILTLALFGVWAALALWAGKRREEAAPKRWMDHLTGLPVLAFFVSVAYVAVPSRVVGVALVSERFASLGLLLWALCPRIDPTRHVTRALLLGGIVIGGVFANYAARTYTLFDDETARPLARALAALPHGRRLSYAKTAEGPVALRENTTRHLPKAIWALQNGGITDDSFAYRPTSPIQSLAGQTPPRPNVRFWQQKPVYREFDYILYRAVLPPPRNAMRGFARQIWHDRWWWLYEVIDGPSHRQPTPGTAGAEGAHPEPNADAGVARPGTMAARRLAAPVVDLNANRRKSLGSLHRLTRTPSIGDAGGPVPAHIIEH